MDYSTPAIDRALFGVCGVAFAAPCLYFAYFTIRLIDLNLTAVLEEETAFLTGRMLTGTIVFPLVAMIFGILSWQCIGESRRSSDGN